MEIIPSVHGNEGTLEDAWGKGDVIDLIELGFRHLGNRIRPRFLPEGWDVISVKHAAPDQRDED